MLTYGSRVWTTRKRHQSRIIAAEVRFIRRTAGYICLDYEQNLNIMKEFNIQPIIKFIKKISDNCKDHDLRMTHSKIPFQILRYQPNRRSIWEDLQTLPLHRNRSLGLRRGSLMMMMMMMIVIDDDDDDINRKMRTICSNWPRYTVRTNTTRTHDMNFMWRSCTPHLTNTESASHAKLSYFMEV
jgi:hypothetical protein